MSAERAYEEVIDFIAAGPSSGKLLAFRPSDSAKHLVSELIAKERAGAISEEEKAELDHYMQLEHFMRMVKIRARQYLANE
jgi:hypothetical protein